MADLIFRPRDRISRTARLGAIFNQHHRRSQNRAHTTMTPAFPLNVTSRYAVTMLFTAVLCIAGDPQSIPEMSLRFSATDEGPLVQILVPSLAAGFHGICVSAGESWRSDWLAVAYVMCRHQGEATFTRLGRTKTFRDNKNTSFILNVHCLGNEQSLDQCTWKRVALITSCSTHLSVSCGECIHTVQLEIGQTTYISSPGYPDQYLYLVTCEWTIQSPEDTLIQFDVIAWKLPGKPDSCNHYVDINGVQSKDGDVTRLCPSDNQNFQKSYESSSNSAMVTLHSGHLIPDAHSRKLGFNIQVKAIAAHTVKDIWFMFKSLVLLLLFIAFVIFILVCYCCMRNYRKRQGNDHHQCCCPFRFNRSGQCRDTSSDGSEWSIHTSIKFPEPDSDGSYLSPLPSETIRSTNAPRIPSLPPQFVHCVHSPPRSAHQMADENEYDIIYTPMDKGMSSSQPNVISGTRFLVPHEDKPFRSLLNLKLAARQRPSPPPLPVFPKHFPKPPTTRPTNTHVPAEEVQTGRLNLKPLMCDSSSMPQLQQVSMGRLVLTRNQTTSALVLPVSHPQPELHSWVNDDPQRSVHQLDSPTSNEDDRVRRPQQFPWMAKVGFRQQRRSRTSGIPLMDIRNN